ncbi:unnamed protein product [Leptosia nina]|uniref:Ankyrin repeat domain-containing protein 49 n=1 Tax=Leptosia nina TaxID=320188 RepID=A0AAV1J5B3_9NEOP
MSSDSEEEALTSKDYMEIANEIEEYKKNPKTSGMFVSGWDDDDVGVDVVKNPKENPIDHVLWAAENGELETITNLLSSHPGLVHAKDSDGYTPLHRASYSNHVNIISYLLSVGANVHSKTELGWTPLHSACKWNNYAAAARLLAGGADTAALSNGELLPLHLTSSIGQCKATLLILLLREEMVDLAQKPNNSKETPEMLAAGHGIYAPLFEMVLPEASKIHSLSFTCNPYTRS